MKKLISCILAAALLGAAPAHAFFGFGGGGLSTGVLLQILAETKVGIALELKELDNLLKQSRALERQIQKGRFNARDLERLHRRIGFYEDMQREDERLETSLADAAAHAAETRRAVALSGLSPKTWAKAEKRFYEQGRETQVRRVERAKRIRADLNDAAAARQNLIAQNKDVAGTVEAIQINNELLGQVLARLDSQAGEKAAEEEKAGKAGERALTEEERRRQEQIERYNAAMQRLRELEADNQRRHQEMKNRNLRLP